MVDFIEIDGRTVIISSCSTGITINTASAHNTELARFKVDIAALSEIHFSDEGYVEEVSAGYTFFYRGRLKAERRGASVAFAIQTDIEENASVENRWRQLRNTVQSIVQRVLSRVRHQHQDRFNENGAVISHLLAEKNCLHKAYRATKSAFYQSRRLVQQRLKEIQDQKKEERPPGNVDYKLDVSGLQQLSSEKASGSDAIHAAIYKYGGYQLTSNLTRLFQEMQRQGQGPQNFKDATIVHLYKRKGNRQLCDNNRGTSLLNIAGKISSRVLINSFNNDLEQKLLPESQCGFRRHRGTTDMIFGTRQLQEKCQEMCTHIYTTFVDLPKAFDRVN
ncbi:unnamed protein product [Dibothriocephalus latus]|uniref:Reverse transcriptase domain-containing protein n=1 Tax=Dibothriocephalus latus TaxID=60516 RepID=A0A3P7KXA6_DIBLA|nr:unnamed protein product [Dibothriocephalus latus]